MRKQHLRNNMDFIDKEFKAKQLDLLNKYNEYFQKESYLKQEINEITAKKEQIVNILEN